MKENKIDNYKELAIKIRIDVLRMIHRAQSAHIGSSLSMADLLAVLYEGILRIDSSKPFWSDRDRFILSKGHGCAAVYSVLAQKGFFPKEWLDTYYLNGAHLPGHITYGIPGVEVSTGSLGHGLSIAGGMALASKHEGRRNRVFVLLSDGECDEGATWEAALFIPHNRLDNLVAIIDYNKIQSFGTVEEVLDLKPLSGKWQSFGWATQEIDGHNLEQIEETLLNVPFEPGRPSCIIAHTIKGKGVSFMEGKLIWHYKPPDDEQLQQALDELETLN